MESYRQEEIDNVANTLKQFGVEMVDENNNYRPFNEVMLDIAKLFNALRKSENKHEYEIQKTYILKSICGARYMNEFM